MNCIKYIVFIILFTFINVIPVQASCSDNEIADLKQSVNEIKITYKHLGKVENDEGTYYNIFEVNVKNVSDELYISYLNNTEKLFPVDGKVTKNLNSGIWNFNINSTKCQTKISEIEIYIPRFNLYSLDPLCEGIDSNDFPLCGKYYEYDVSYNDFVDRVNYYRSIHKIDNKVSTNENNKKNVFTVVFDEMLNIFVNYKIHVIISFVALSIIIIASIVIKRRRKRGVLE